MSEKATTTSKKMLPAQVLGKEPKLRSDAGMGVEPSFGCGSGGGTQVVLMGLGMEPSTTAIKLNNNAQR